MTEHPAIDPQGIIADAIRNPSESEPVARDRLFMWLLGLERSADPVAAARELLAREDVRAAEGNLIVPLLREVVEGGIAATAAPKRRGGRGGRVEQA